MSSHVCHHVFCDFQTNATDTKTIVDRVATLFQGNAELIEGFNAFLPAEHKIKEARECSVIFKVKPRPLFVPTCAQYNVDIVR